MSQGVLDQMDRLRQHRDRLESPFRPNGTDADALDPVRAKSCDCRRPISDGDDVHAICVKCGRMLGA